MSSLVLTGLTTITTFHLFDGLDQLPEDFGNILSWIHSKLPTNKFARFTIYTVGGVVLLRAMPFIFRRTGFFMFYETQSLFFHRSCNHKEILEMKHELIGDLAQADLPKLQDDKLVILELNIGSGTNVSYYPPGSYVIGTDFVEEEKEKIENNFLLNEEEGQVKLNRYIHTRVEELQSVPDRSVSCVVSFHSLCSARKVDRAMAEINRVLMPNGRLYFIEHTTEKQRFSRLWFWQVNFRPTMFMISCCMHCPEKFIENAGFSKVSYKTTTIDMSRIRGPLSSLSPHIYGYAIK